MKKLIYIFAFLLIASCKEESSKAMDTEALSVEKSDTNASWNTTSSKKYKYSTDETFEFRELASQKLQELYDLSILKNNHPEFKESITLQLKNFTNDSLLLSRVSDSVSIKNIQFITEGFKTNAITQKVKLRYDFVINNSIKSDSINAEIISEKIIFEGKEIISNKIKFSKI